MCKILTIFSVHLLPKQIVWHNWFARPALVGAAQYYYITDMYRAIKETNYDLLSEHTTG